MAGPGMLAMVRERYGSEFKPEAPEKLRFALACSGAE
jgi:hypothetical protein